MAAGGVISSLGTVRDDRLCFLGRRGGRQLGLGRGVRNRRRLGRRRRLRLVEHFGQFVEDGIASQAQLAQNFSYRAHNLGQAFGADYDQRDREDESYFKKIRQTSMTACERNSMISRGAEKLRAIAPCQLIIIPDWGVNDA